VRADSESETDARRDEERGGAHERNDVHCAVVAATVKDVCVRFAAPRERKCRSARAREREREKREPSGGKMEGA